MSDAPGYVHQHQACLQEDDSRLMGLSCDEPWQLVLPEHYRLHRDDDVMKAGMQIRTKLTSSPGAPAIKDTCVL